MTEEPQRDFHAGRLPTMPSLAVELLLVKRLWPRNPITRRAEAADLDETVTGRIERSAACCLMMRRAAFDQINGFDEQFTPAWFEDADLCKRLIDAGWSIYFVPSAVFRHIGGASVRTLGRARRKRIFYRNMERYVRKHYGRIGARNGANAARDRHGAARRRERASRRSRGHARLCRRPRRRAEGMEARVESPRRGLPARPSFHCLSRSARCGVARRTFPDRASPPVR